MVHNGQRWQPVDDGRRQVADGKTRRRVVALQAKTPALPGDPGFRGGRRQGGRVGDYNGEPNANGDGDVLMSAAVEFS